jgi:Helix-turn-helix domain
MPRAGLVKAALAGQVTNRQGAEALAMTVRQFRRLKRRYQAEAAAGLLHQLRGTVFAAGPEGGGPRPGG